MDEWENNVQSPFFSTTGTTGNKSNKINSLFTCFATMGLVLLDSIILLCMYSFHFMVMIASAIRQAFESLMS